MVHVEVIFMLLLFLYFVPEVGCTMFLANIYATCLKAADNFPNGQRVKGRYMDFHVAIVTVHPCCLALYDMAVAQNIFF